jgi:hypothetical protein
MLALFWGVVNSVWAVGFYDQFVQGFIVLVHAGH